MNALAWKAAAAVALGAVVMGGLLYLTLPDVGALVKDTPKTSAVIEQRRSEATAKKQRFSPDRRWVPLGRISPKLVAAVLLSEDASFYLHEGFDWRELENAMEKDLESKSFARGASTITQQLAKNLYLGTQKSLIRKLREALITLELEHRLSKNRILALYLNFAEWGEGVFGAEAGAHHCFGVSAAELSAGQAALMAAMLPAPRRANPKAPSAALIKKARHIVGLMHDSKRIGDEELSAATLELEALAKGPDEPETED